MSEPPGFREFVEARSPALLRTAWMLTGDAAMAEDLLQSALARTWPHWSRVVQGGYPDAYVRKVMLRLNASWKSRRWNQERPVAEPASPLRSVHPDEHARSDDRAVLMKALAALPVRQRQVVVLRFFDDLSVESVADLLGVSTGTVKSQTAKGLSKLRASIGVTLTAQEEV